MDEIKIRLLRSAPHGLLRAALGVVEMYNRPVRWLARRAFHITALEKLDLHATKTSSAVFILGSGSSLGKISAERWEQIGACDSFGFNFTSRHPFVPTHYFFEAHRPAAFDHTVRFAQMRVEDYRDVIKIVLPGFPQSAWYEWRLRRLPPQWLSDLYGGGVYRLVARDKEELAREVTRLLRAGGFALGRPRVGSLVKHMGSLSSLVSLAAFMGYEHIVLCGFDITDPRYFYDDPELYPDMVDYVRKVRLPAERAKEPSVSSQASGDLVLMELHRQVLEPAGIKLWVEHPSSGLHPRLPVAPAEVYGG